VAAYNESMFIRRTTRKYKGEEFENYLLVESVRTAAGPRQKTIASLGDLRPRPREAWLELAHKVERSLAGEADLLAPPDPEAENVARRVRDRKPRRDASHVRVRKLKAGDGHAIVLCHSAERVAKDRAIREKAEGRLLKDLKALEARVADGKLKAPGRIWETIGRLRERHARVARYYDIKFDDKKGALAWSRDDVKLKVAEELDGTYIIKTDRDDLSAEEAWRTYMLLTRVENAFRDLKSPLSERPIFHRLETRVQSHIFLCVLAYHLLNAIELTLRRSGESVSWETVKGELSTHQVATVVLPTTDGAVLRIRRDCSPESRHLDLYRRLEIGQRVMEPRRSWTETAGNEKRAAEQM